MMNLIPSNGGFLRGLLLFLKVSSLSGPRYWTAQIALLHYQPISNCLSPHAVPSSLYTQMVLLSCRLTPRIQHSSITFRLAAHVCPPPLSDILLTPRPALPMPR